MYLSYILADIGYNLQEWNFVSLLLVLVGWAALVYRIYAEERLLAQHSGWRGYAASVRSRLLAGLWCRRCFHYSWSNRVLEISRIRGNHSSRSGRQAMRQRLRATEGREQPSTKALLVSSVTVLSSRRSLCYGGVRFDCRKLTP